MNVLIFGSRIIYGGGEKMLNWLADRLINNEDSVYFATPRDDDEYEEKLRKVGLSGRVSVVEYPFHIKYKRPLEYFKSWRRIYRDNQIDLLLIFGGSLWEQWAAMREGVKIVLSERWYPNARPFASRVLKQLQYWFADGYVFQTIEASKCFSKKAQKRCVIIPNPIIDKLPDPHPIERKEIVTVGRLSPEKNQQLVIKAFSRFTLDHPDYKLKIYGSGPLKSELEALITTSSLNDKVEIIEGKRNIAELINGSDLFVLPSNVEGMPNALIEAMAMGVTSISTDCPAFGSRMLINDGVNGYLTPLNDDLALYSVMKRAIEEQDRERIQKNAVGLRITLDPNMIARRWLDYFAKVVSM